MKISVLIVSGALLSGCGSLADSLVDTHGPLEDRNQGAEFAELDKQAVEMQKSIDAARRGAKRQSRR